MRELVNCKRVGCEYYRKYNGVQKTPMSGYMSDFMTIDERCSHPESIKKQPRTPDDPGGIRLISLNECPNGN
jgi:hypothetical protein